MKIDELKDKVQKYKLLFNTVEDLKTVVLNNGQWVLAKLYSDTYISIDSRLASAFLSIHLDKLEEELKQLGEELGV